MLHYLRSADLSKSISLLNQYLSFLNIFFNTSCLVERSGVNPYCLYHDLLMLDRRCSTGSKYTSCLYSGIAKLFSFAKEITALNCRLFCIIWENEEKKRFKVLCKNNISESRKSCPFKSFFMSINHFYQNSL